jgi:hypothetical protein
VEPVASSVENLVVDVSANPVMGFGTSRQIAVVVSAVLVRPGLWWTALGELRRMAPRLWWRSAPHLPLPDRRLWEFRMVTAYGRPDAAPNRDDVISFLEWCRATTATASPTGGHR